MLKGTVALEATRVLGALALLPGSTWPNTSASIGGWVFLLLTPPRLIISLFFIPDHFILIGTEVLFLVFVYAMMRAEGLIGGGGMTSQRTSVVLTPHRDSVGGGRRGRKSSFVQDQFIRGRQSGIDYNPEQGQFSGYAGNPQQSLQNQQPFHSNYKSRNRDQ
jgi:hypothetical protein